MELKRAETIAKDLIAWYVPGYAFKFSRAVTFFGWCSWVRREISLSSILVSHNNEDEVITTILHEIAHALAPGNHHGELWAAKCVELGIKPVRCYDTAGNGRAVVTTKRPYKAICPIHGKIGESHRRYTNRICKRCRSKIVYANND